MERRANTGVDNIISRMNLSQEQARLMTGGMQGVKPRENQEIASKSQGAANRSERANIVQEARQARGGERLRSREKRQIEKRQIEKQAKQNIKLKNPGCSKGEVEQKLKEMVRNKGFGKLASKIALRNGETSTLRASQIKLATEE